MEGHVAKLSMAGFARIHLREDGKLVGDSGWIKNAITEFGIVDFLANNLASNGTEKVAVAALGTGDAPATNTASLPGEITDETHSRDAVSSSVVTGAGASVVTCQWYGTFASTDSHLSGSHVIKNIGLYNSSATNAGSVLCGATYTISTLDTNQDVEYTYEWRFATTT